MGFRVVFQSCMAPSHWWEPHHFSKRPALLASAPSVLLKKPEDLGLRGWMTTANGKPRSGFSRVLCQSMTKRFRKVGVGSWLFEGCFDFCTLKIGRNNWFSGHWGRFCSLGSVEDPQTGNFDAAVDITLKLLILF